MTSPQDSPNPNNTHVAAATESGVDEETPLLVAETETETQPSDNNKPAPALNHRRRRRVVLFIFLIYFLLEFTAGLFIPGYYAILEERICHDAYSSSPAGEKDCKSPEVQGKIAALRGWQTTLEAIPGLVASVPFGILSDKWGRHRVLALAFIGGTLNTAWQIFVISARDICPVELVLLSPIFGLIGGGPAVIMAMIYTSLADIVPAESRANVFLQLTSLFIISDIASGPLAGLIMTKSIWAVVWLSLGLLCLDMFLAFCCPDTLSLVEKTSSQPQPISNGGHSATNGGDTTLEDDHHQTASSSPVRESLHRARKSLAEAWSFLSGHWHLLVLMLCFVFVVLSRLVQDMLLQYTTKRYNWSWGRASVLLTVRSVTMLVTLIVILPALSRFLTTRLRMSAVRKDLWIARATGIAGIVGALLIALAAKAPVLIIGLVVFAFNGGMAAVIRSLLSSLVEPHHFGTLNSLIGVLEMVGLMVAAPSLFQSLKLGLEMGGAWIGLPFFIAAGMISVSTFIIWFFPVREKDKVGEADD
ncbi:major facilitator superfamily domain-containing protein [Echria macrotheca]|uniref:Major facilitator superfamily domain-containing protein n=1 Tax=Echria macrotheca TaxID=438768 RepID=A0AAJ0B9S0_9PEZI|nr:major facilitator superfamily domain-containing protein [Echria macrotheca]